MFVARQIEAQLRGMLSKYPILALTGPRQSGKTTLLQKIFPDYQYLSLENTDLRAFAEQDPIGLLKKYPQRIIFDEAQRVPHLFSYLQTTVDQSGIMGQFVISGSQNFHLMSGITQSLAGRVALFKLLPLDFMELKRAGLLPSDWQSLLFNGCYPAIYDRNLNPSVFYSNYLQTYIDRDVRELSRVQDLRLFRNFLTLCAARTGQLLNLAGIANECGISQPTAKAWLSVLESSYIVFQLQPYFQNFNKRVSKTPKLYFYDTGLVCFLLDMRQPEDLNIPTLMGSLFENLVVAEIHKQNHHLYRLKEYWFWRDATGNEVDLLSKSGPLFELIEVKSTQTILPNLFKGLDYFSDVVEGKVKSRTLIYGGSESQSRTRYEIRAWDDL